MTDAAAGTPAVALGPAEKRLVLVSLCLALFMVMLDGTVVNTALPKMQARPRCRACRVCSGSSTATCWPSPALMLTGGTLGDRFGRRRMLVSGITVFTIGSVLCGLAPDTWALIGRPLPPGRRCGRPDAGHAVHPVQRVHRARPSGPGPSGSGPGVSGIALASGPVVGGLLADTLGWPSIFFVNLPVGILAVVVIRRVTPESSDPEGRRPDLGRRGPVGAGVGPAHLRPHPGQRIGLGLPAHRRDARAGPACPSWRCWWSRAAIESPMLHLQFFRNPTFAAAVASGALVTFSLFGMNVYFSLFFQRAQGHSALESGLRMLTISAVMAVGMPIAGRLTSTLRLQAGDADGHGASARSGCSAWSRWRPRRATSPSGRACCSSAPAWPWPCPRPRRR